MKSSNAVRSAVGRTGDAGDRLQPALIDVLLERHRGRSDVTTLLERLFRPDAAQFGQLKPVRNASQHLARRDVEALLVFEEPQPLVDHREGKTQMTGQFVPRQAAAHVDLLDQQFGDLSQRQPGVVKRLRRTRRQPVPRRFLAQRLGRTVRRRAASLIRRLLSRRVLRRHGTLIGIGD